MCLLPGGINCANSMKSTGFCAQDRQREKQERADEEDIEYAFKLAALYITLAFALQPKRDVYKRSLKVSGFQHTVGMYTRANLSKHTVYSHRTP